MADAERAARDRAIAVLGVEDRKPAARDLPADGTYLDLLTQEPPSTGIAQRLMGTAVVPAVYERWWRPALGRVAKGPLGPSMDDELGLARELLEPSAGETVLDVACGPGNFTRAFAEDVGEHGLVIGLDVSRTMLERAVADTAAPQVVYVRADITARSLRPASVDAICCFAALHLFASPGTALDVMADAMAPGGRLAILTSARPRGPVLGSAATVAGHLSGMAMFDVRQLGAELERRGLEVVEQRRFGVVQVVGARRPADG
jgi:SAM-dependent methyltransferase